MLESATEVLNIVDGRLSVARSANQEKLL
jgi:hypothetical protein